MNRARHDVRQGIAARGATRLGNDFGRGGLSFLINREGIPIIVHERQFSPVDAKAPLSRWSQFVAVVQNAQMVVYLDGQPAGMSAASRTLDLENHGGFQLGTARLPDMDYVGGDGLIGAIGLVRVYERSLAMNGTWESISTPHRSLSGLAEHFTRSRQRARESIGNWRFPKVEQPC